MSFVLSEVFLNILRTFNNTIKEDKVNLIEYVYYIFFFFIFSHKL